MGVYNPEQLKKILVESGKHARNVILRGTVIPERATRIGEFVTSLRRELHGYHPSYTGGDLRHVREMLLDKNIWDDVLVLRPKHYDVELGTIIQSAREEIMESSPETISIELDEMDRKIKGAETFVTRAREINKQAEGIMKEFEEFAEERK